MAEQHLNAAGTHVYVYNPETDGLWECPVDYLPVALARGFELAGPPPGEDLTDLFDEPKPVAKKAATKTATNK